MWREKDTIFREYSEKEWGRPVGLVVTVSYKENDALHAPQSTGWILAWNKGISKVVHAFIIIALLNFNMFIAQI